MTCVENIEERNQLLRIFDETLLSADVQNAMFKHFYISFMKIVFKENIIISEINTDLKRKRLKRSS